MAMYEMGGYGRVYVRNPNLLQARLNHEATSIACFFVISHTERLRLEKALYGPRKACQNKQEITHTSHIHR
jgi:hypothetical protein